MSFPPLRPPPGAPAGELRQAAGLSPSRCAELAFLADRLARAAWVDAATGLANRRHAMARLGHALRGPGVALVALRGLAADAGWFGARAEMLDAYPRRVPGAFVARLSDHDLLLCLPVPGLAAETAATLRQTLRNGPDDTAFVMAALEAGAGAGPDAALDAVARALQRAQAGGAFQLDLQDAGAVLAPADSERAWRARVERALAVGRCRLSERPALDADGQVPISLSPLWVQPEDDAELEAGVRCLSGATRRRLQPRLDEKAVTLALQAVQRDRRPRCVRIDAASLAIDGFVASVARALQAHPAAARVLCLSIVGAVGSGRGRSRLQAAAGQWRLLGAAVGIEPGVLHAARWPLLADLGLSQVLLDGRLFQDMGRGTAVPDALRGLARLAHALGWRVLVDAPSAGRSEAAALHAAGVDAVVLS